MCQSWSLALFQVKGSLYRTCEQQKAVLTNRNYSKAFTDPVATCHYTCPASRGWYIPVVSWEEAQSRKQPSPGCGEACAESLGTRVCIPKSLCPGEPTRAPLLWQLQPAGLWSTCFQEVRLVRACLVCWNLKYEEMIDQHAFWQEFQGTCALLHGSVVCGLSYFCIVMCLM